MATTIIDGMPFTLYYNYDQVIDRKLSLLSNQGKVMWFSQRMELVFLEPLRRLIDPNSVAHKELNSSDDIDTPRRTAIIATFSLLLNGIEALGSFVSSNGSSKKNAFLKYVQQYMQGWDISISPSFLGTSSSYLPEILWKYYRNGIAHGFVIEKGNGLDYSIAPKTWDIQPTGLMVINPVAFFHDFMAGLNRYLADIADPQKAEHQLFLINFSRVYPH